MSFAVTILIKIDSKSGRGEGEKTQMVLYDYILRELTFPRFVTQKSFAPLITCFKKALVSFRHQKIFCKFWVNVTLFNSLF